MSYAEAQSELDVLMRLTVDGAPVPERGREPAVAYRVVSPRYFETMRIPIVEGRAFDGRDSAGGAPVAIVNRTLARRFLGEPITALRTD